MDRTQRTNAAFYDRYAAAWAESHTHSFHLEPQFRRFVRYFKTGDAILDMGCATGIHVPLFLGIGRHLRYASIDISRAFVNMARTRYPQLPFHVANIADRRTLPRRTFAGFWASAVLMHVPECDWPAMLANIERLVRKGGIGYLAVPRQRPNPPSRSDQRHFTLLSLRRFRALLAARRWRVLERGAVHGSTVRNNWSWCIVRLPE